MAIKHPVPRARLIQPEKPVDVLIVDPAVTDRVMLKRYQEKFRQQGHDVVYTHFRDKGAIKDEKLRKRFFDHLPTEFKGSSLPAKVHSLMAAEYFLYGFNQTSKSNTGRKFKFHIVTIPSGFRRAFPRPDGGYIRTRKKPVSLVVDRRRRPEDRKISELPTYKFIDQYIERNPGIQIMVAPFEIEGSRTADRNEFFDDSLNELASKNGRRILVGKAGGNVAKTPQQLTNVTGYQDFELRDSAYKHFTLVAQKVDKSKKSFVSKQPYAPQFIHEPDDFAGTSFSAPEAVGWVAGFLENAVTSGRLNGNTVVPAMVLDRAIDNLRRSAVQGGNINIQGKDHLFRLIKGSLNDIIRSQNTKPALSADNISNLDFGGIGG